MFASRCAVVDVGKFVERFLLPVENLVDHHPGDMFLHERVDTGDLNPDIAVCFAGFLAEYKCSPEQERQNAERDQRELPIHRKHEIEDTDDREHIAEDHHDAGREHVVEHFHVVGDSGDESSDRILVVELERQLLEVRKNLHPQIEDGALADPLCKIGIRVLDQTADDEDDQEQRDRDKQTAFVVVGDIGVDGNFGEIRTHSFHRADDEGHDDTTGNVPLVRPQILDQAPHQPRIVGFTECFFFVHKSGTKSKVKRKKGELIRFSGYSTSFCHDCPKYLGNLFGLTTQSVEFRIARQICLVDES